MLLEQIIDSKKKEIARQETAVPLGILTSALARLEKPRGFKKSLVKGNSLTIIAEIKQASPVKGLLCSAFNPVKLAEAYRDGGAGLISVITEEHFFRGSPAYIGRVKNTVELPVLRKDFILSEYQVFESRVIGADAILLIAAILDSYMLKRLITLAGNLGMDALVEVHDRNELERAIAAGAGIIGINNRNLKTFKVSLANTLELIGHVPAGIPTVSESGISSRAEIELLEQAGVRAALIGEALVRSKDPAALLNSLRGCTKTSAGPPAERVESCG
ncbi:MAG: indole-3-glycerol phosphate synthase TrpC [Bacillota bacterium]|nr:indole-3-glycerol phosphate synthase TrpC [Bacillota bacterium]